MSFFNQYFKTKFVSTTTMLHDNNYLKLYQHLFEQFASFFYKQNINISHSIMTKLQTTQCYS